MPDSHFTASNGFPARKVYVEGVDYLPGLAGESRNFDSNGPYIRVGMSAGAALTYTLANGSFGQSMVPLLGAQPSLADANGGKRPPLMANVACETQPVITDLTAKTSAPIKPVIPASTPGGTPTIPTLP